MLFWKSAKKSDTDILNFLHLFKHGKYIADMFQRCHIPYPLNHLLSFILTTFAWITLLSSVFLHSYLNDTSGTRSFPLDYSVPSRFSFLAGFLYFAAAMSKLISLLFFLIFETVFGRRHHYALYLHHMMPSFSKIFFCIMAIVYFGNVLKLQLTTAIKQTTLDLDTMANEETAFKFILIYTFVSIAMLIEKIIVFFITDAYETQSPESRLNINTVEIVEKLRKRYYDEGKGKGNDKGMWSLEAMNEDIANSKEIANAIYSNMKAQSISASSSTSLHSPTKGLIPRDFEGVISEQEIAHLFQAIDFDESGEISQEELGQALKILYQERLHHFKSRMDTSSIFRLMEKIFKFIIWYNAFLLATFLFDVKAVTFVFALLGGALLTWLSLDNTINSVLRTGNVIFFIHPFDVGDRIIYRDVTYSVKGMNFFSTVLVGPGNVTTYIMNDEFDCDKLTNLRRSDFQSESIDLNIAPQTVTQEKLETLEASLNSFLRKNGDDFMPKCSIGFLRLDNSDSAKISVSYAHKGNFNDGSMHGRRCRAFNRELYKQFRIIDFGYGG